MAFIFPRRKLLRLAAPAIIGVASPAMAAWPGSGRVYPQNGSSYVGPGDIVPFTAWYSCAFGYNGSYASPGTNPAMQLRLGASTLQDIAVTTSGAVNVAAALAFAGTDATGIGSITGTTLTFTGGTIGDTVTGGTTAAGTYIVSGASPTWQVNISQTVVSATLTLINKLTVARIYDQTGGGRTLVSGGAATEPIWVPGLVGTAPGGVFTSGSITTASSGNFTPTSATASFSTVAERLSGTGPAVFIRENGFNNRVGTQSGVANKWTLTGGSSGTINATANDAAPHAANIVLNGASSVINLDGTETTGTATGNTTAGTINNTGAASTTSYWSEAGFIDNVAITSGNRTSLNSNQHTRYAF